MPDNVSVLTLHAEYDPVPPKDRIKPYWPERWTRRAWIPSTLGCLVWCIFDFENEQERLKWEASLPDEFRRSLINDQAGPLIERFGWYTRDAMSGFEQGDYTQPRVLP